MNEWTNERLHQQQWRQCSHIGFTCPMNTGHMGPYAGYVKPLWKYCHMRFVGPTYDVAAEGNECRSKQSNYTTTITNKKDPTLFYPFVHCPSFIASLGHSKHFRVAVKTSRGTRILIPWTVSLWNTMTQSLLQNDHILDRHVCSSNPQRQVQDTI